jgi:hypothetical protein
LVYDDVLPVRTSVGTRYLTSARVERLTVADQPVRLQDGLSESVDIAKCRAAGIAADRKRTANLSAATTYRAIDLGAGIPDPYYPILADEARTGVNILRDLDTCALANGPFAKSTSRASSAPGTKGPGVPAVWPLGALQTRSYPTDSFADRGAGSLDLVQWRTGTSAASALMWRPTNGSPVVSSGDPETDLQMFVLPIAGGELAAFYWDTTQGGRLVLPDGSRPLFEQTGLVVVPKPDRAATFRLNVRDKIYSRTLR